MNIFNNFIEFIFNERIRLSSKATMIVFSILAIVLFDNILGFTYYFSTDKKIGQIQKLNSIINDITTDSTTIDFATQLRSEIIDRENVFFKISSFSKHIKWISYNKKYQTDIPNGTVNEIEVVIKNNFWFHLTSSGFWYIMAIMMFPIMLFYGEKTTSLFHKLGIGFLTSVIMLFFGLLFFLFCNFIPKISETTWIWNYLINFLIQVLIFSLFAVIENRKGSTTNNTTE